MSCEDIPSLLDLQKVKKHADDFGRLMGTGGGTSTNGVTGQVRPTYNKVINDMNSEFDGMIVDMNSEFDSMIVDMNSEFDAQILNMGFTRVGTFATGATLTNPRQTLLWDLADGGDGQEYGWSGVFPPSGKLIPPGSTPLTTGGISVGAWISRFDPELRIQIREALRRSYAEAGYNLVNGSFEAGGTLVNANDVLLQERTGKGFSGPAGTVAAGTDPAGGGFVDKSGGLLRHELATSATPAKLVNTKVVSGAGQPTPFAILEQHVWGATSSRVFRSTDGITWVDVMASPGGNTVTRMEQCDDGEVVAVTSNAIYRSVGWPSASTTWQLKINSSGGEAIFTLGSLSGNGQKFIACEYAGAQAGWIDSKYAWISLDQGITWTVAYDAPARYGADAANTHIHCCCYDEEMDRFFVVEGHASVKGIYWTDDLGTTWTRMEDEFAASVFGGEPVFLTPTPSGIVCGTDSDQQGVFLITRADKGADMRLRWVYEKNYGAIGLGIWTFCQTTDPKTGIVYMGYRAEASGGFNRACIIASDGIGSEVVWESDNVASSVYFVSSIAVTPNGKLLWTTSGQTSARYIADIPPAGALALSEYDTGGVLGGRKTGESGGINQALSVGIEAQAGTNSTAVGFNARANGDRQTAVGRNAKVDSAQGVAIGNNALATGGTAIGGGAQSLSQGLAIGLGAKALYHQDIAIGENVETLGTQALAIGILAGARTRAVALGLNAQAFTDSVSVGLGAGIDNAPDAVSVGRNAKANQDATAVGRNAAAAFNSSAYGKGANAGATSTTALGNTASATAQSCVAVGTNSQSTNTAATAVGTTAVASGFESTAIGRQATASASGSTALGKSATASHDNGVALGAGTSTQRINSVCVGNRDIESTKAGGGIYLKSPNGTLYVVTVSNSGTLTVTAV